MAEFEARIQGYALDLELDRRLKIKRCEFCRRTIDDDEPNIVDWFSSDGDNYAHQECLEEASRG